MQPKAGYTGVENLEVMEDAVKYNRYLLDLVKTHAPAQGTIVDFGAGSGQFAIPLRAAGVDILAVEPDLHLRQRMASRGLRTIDNTKLLPDGSIACVYTLNVLEHIQDDVAALRDLHRALAPTGRIIVYVPAFPILFTSMDAKVGHVRRYTKRELKENLEAAGFQIQSIAFVDSLGFFATLLFKMLGRNDGNVSRGALIAYDRLVFPLSRLVDLVSKRFFGKNLLVIATKRE